jgi:hypothetical protein
MPEKCKQEECNFDRYESAEYCVLHCEKHDYQTDKNSGLLHDFTHKLIDYIIHQLFSKEYLNKIVNYNRYTIDGIRLFLYEICARSESPVTNIVAKYHLDVEIIKFSGINFPDRDSRDSGHADYFKVFEFFSGYEFDTCTFRLNSFSDQIRNKNFFFQDCTFKNQLFLKPLGILVNQDGFLFLNCTFEKDVNAIYEKLDDVSKEITENSNNLFNMCTFKAKLYLEGLTFTGYIFSEVELEERKELNILSLESCVIRKKLFVNNNKISSFLSKDSVFEDKFEFKHNEVDSFEINNSNFNELVDCFETEFKRFNVEKSIFREFVGFEHCKFGLKTDKRNKELISVFRYATFLSFINFRKTRFFNGLDIENINLLQPPNFLGTEINPTNTNRETIRIVKYSFDEVGNHIEANRFYSMEMEAYKREMNLDIHSKAKSIIDYLQVKVNSLVKELHNKYFIKLFKFFKTSTIIVLALIFKIFKLDYWVFFVSGLSSKYSKNWLLPLLWFMIISLFFFKFEKSIEITFDLRSFDFDLWKENAQNFLKYINLFETKPGDEYNVFLWIPHRVISLYLIYQFIIAARRQTKR